MLSKKLQGASVNYLIKYSLKKRTRPLSTKTQTEISDLIRERHINNSIFAKQIINSRMFKLATIQMKKRGQTTRIKLLESEIYCLDFSKVFATMSEIVNEGLKKGFFK